MGVYRCRFVKSGLIIGILVIPCHHGIKSSFYSDSYLANSAQASPAGQLGASLLKRRYDEFMNEYPMTTSQIVDPAHVFETYCERDYSAACPEGWTQGSKAAFCMAGPSYSGSLAAYFPIPVSVSEKQGIEKKYGIQWPCVETCVQDFGLPCPQGWILESESLCVSHTNEQLPHPFSLTPADKARYADAHDVRWPCVDACQRDYWSPCPIGWTPTRVYNVTHCKAPSWYQGDCPSLQRLEGVSVALRQAFEARCKVQFPCKACSAEDKNYGVDCPEGFMAKDNVCALEPGRTMKSKCPTSFQVPQSKEEKANLEMQCAVDYPCFSPSKPLTNCAQDFSQPCPLQWVYEPPDFCRAPSTYRGRCPAKFRVLQTTLFKTQIAAHCAVQFPCLHDSAADLWLPATNRSAQGVVPEGRPKAPPAWNGPINIKGVIDTGGTS